MGQNKQINKNSFLQMARLKPARSEACLVATLLGLEFVHRLFTSRFQGTQSSVTHKQLHLMGGQGAGGL